VPPFDSLGMVSYLTFIATVAVSHHLRDTLTYWSKIAQFLTHLVFGAPVRGEAVGVKQRPSVMKNWNDGAIRS